MLSLRWVSMIGLLLLSVACGGDGDNDDAADTEPTRNAAGLSTAAPASTRAPATSASGATTTSSSAQPVETSESAAPTPTATQPSSAVQPTKPPATDGPRLTGEATRDDGTDDLHDSDGNAPDETDPALDLSRVTLSGDGSALTVTFELHNPLPDPMPTGVTYRYDIGVLVADPTGGSTIAIVYSELMGGWSASVSQDLTFESTDAPAPPTIGERSLSATFPAEMFPNIDGPFRWFASAKALGFDGTVLIDWSDAVPDGAGINPPAGSEVFVPFPD